MTPSGIYGRSWAIVAPILLISAVINVANVRGGFSSPVGTFASAVGTLSAACALYYALQHGSSRKSRWTYSVGPAGVLRTRHGKVSLIPWEVMGGDTSARDGAFRKRRIGVCLVYRSVN